ncbi:hypothetical protein NE237_028600 [Protea cynaroides]|uniref:Uncharacterized protein n=1 Tax=Protea cynaroides TaxID=273540 RepID=A0A9Q0JVF3_9MAGN|nr:hypothetical protein NE237_028600 [Protea cynaroides]
MQIAHSKGDDGTHGAWVLERQVVKSGNSMVSEKKKTSINQLWFQILRTITCSLQMARSIENCGTENIMLMGILGFFFNYCRLVCRNFLHILVLYRSFSH